MRTDGDSLDSPDGREPPLVVRALLDAVWRRGDLSAVDAALAADFRLHHPVWPDPPLGPASLREIYGTFLRGFPDAALAVEDLVHAHDRVLVRWVIRGTQRGPFLEIAPTGRAVTYEGMYLFRVAGGRIAELWVQTNLLGLLEQLGATLTRPGARPQA